MIITVVNRSQYTDEAVQEVIRAVNRQIHEDFARYWHRSGELRLEGPIGRRPDPRNPQELRGDAILYLWDEIDQQDALGYHDLNYRGIPFGIVFTELSEQMGEDWSVTFSHEALELIMDPEANLLARGPHPEDPNRLVYHWYEVCDAVQGQTYEIDGVLVTNFVLPLYFTEHDEEGSRNDFLGTEGEHGPLRSFGVAPGGYIGFFDPETGEHDQYFSPRGRSRERWNARLRAGWARRAVRRQRETSPEPVVRRLLNRGPEEPLPGPWFEGFAIDVRAPRGGDPYGVLERACTAVLGRAWRRRWLAVEPTEAFAPEDVTPYELVPQGHAVSPSEAWSLTYALREQRGVVDVEPDFVLFRPDPEAIEGLPARRRWALFGAGHLPGTEGRYEWGLEQIRARAAWEHSRGEGVAIGHPDTGYLPHPELGPSDASGPIDTTRDWDFRADDDDARAEPEEDGILPGGPNHGTATASVIVSRAGSNGGAGAPFVSGVAPAATLVPLRVSNSVVHFSMRRVRKAIEYAAREGFHVVSMSLGGPLPSRRLEWVIREATRRGLILIAAAGNHVPFRPVVWPARYRDVVGVAACNADRKPWSGSSRGEAIDITAPGESVWRALVDTEESEAAKRYRVERSSGTSYATAHVAGVCALWLSHHTPAALAARYGERLADAFRYVLAHTAQASEHLKPGEFGPGIVDAQAALAFPLPSRDRVARWADGGLGRRLRRSAVTAEGGLEALQALFPGLSSAQLRAGLEGLLATTESGLDRVLRDVGDELLFQFGTDPRLCRRFAATCRDLGRAPRARTAAARLWCADLCEPLHGSLRRRASGRLSGRLERGASR